MRRQMAMGERSDPRVSSETRRETASRSFCLISYTSESAWYCTISELDLTASFTSFTLHGVS